MSKAEINITGVPYFPGVATGRLLCDATQAAEGGIVVLTQDEVSTFTQPVEGIIVIEAAPFSHPMIGLLGLARPTVLISREQAAELKAGRELLIDGSRGLVTDQLHRLSVQPATVAVPQPGQPVSTADAVPVKLCASVRSVEATRQAVGNGACEIGLVRTEYLMPDGEQAPTAGFYLAQFRQLCEAAAGLGVNMRLLDIAADKAPPWLSLAGIADQCAEHPLGLNGVRLYGQPAVWQVVEAQLQAISELSSEFELRVLLPYITSADEFDKWRQRVRERLPAQVNIGLVAETPASVLDLNRLQQQADFVAIGCNDLIQHLYAADRDLPNMRDFLDPYSPVLYRLLRQVAESVGQQAAEVQLCGLLAGFPGVLPVLFGLGYRRFSVDAALVPHLAQTVSAMTLVQCEAIANRVCQASTSDEVHEIVQN